MECPPHHRVGIRLEKTDGGQSFGRLKTIDDAGTNRRNTHFTLRCVKGVDDLRDAANDGFADSGVDQPAGQDQGQLQLLVEHLGDLFRFLTGQLEQILQQAFCLSRFSQVLNVTDGNGSAESTADQRHVLGGKARDWEG